MQMVVFSTVLDNFQFVPQTKKQKKTTILDNYGLRIEMAFFIVCKV